MTSATDSSPYSSKSQGLARRGRRMNLLFRYVRWLHTMWPAGTVEKLPQVNPDGSTNVPGVYVVGDLTGIPLLKFSADTGAKAVQKIVQEGSGVRVQGSGFRKCGCFLFP